MAEKLSVIIPVYRTEKYLRKCLSSVLTQSYENLEIIIVDDGSDDNCPKICDEFAKEDERVTVIHKSNGGLSSARNSGLEKATGEFITFVDSDDYIESDMYSYMLSERGECDIVCCSHFTEKDGEKAKVPSFEKKTVLDTNSAVKEILQDGKIKNYVWNKIFKKELFDGVTFPEGMAFEDIPVTPVLFTKAKSVCVLPEGKYNYLIRSDGISKTESIANLCDRFRAHLMRYGALSDKYPDEKTLMQKQMLHAARLLAFGLLSQYSEENEKRAYEVCFSYYKENKEKIVELGGFNAIEKKQIYLLGSAEKKDLMKIKNIDYLRKAEKLLRR